jgi:4-hydroxybenzoate polyprenyltransferase
VNDQAAGGPSLSGHLAIARVDHWFKNVFALPGLVLALVVEPQAVSGTLLVSIVLGLLALCLMASSNYTVNELVDAKFDLLHPDKQARPVPAGRVHIGLGYLQWLALMLLALGLASQVSMKLVYTLGALWFMGAVYNLRPLRSKDLPYGDVITEAVNNPLRLLAGWFIIDPVSLPPASLLLSYWMVGCYFMALKRYAELRAIGDPQRAAAYRRSFAHYTEERLLGSVMFYASAAMLLFGTFIMRYRIELVLAYPFVAWVMASYLSLALQADSPVQRPEELYKQPRLLLALLFCSLTLVLLLFIDLPWLRDALAPWGPESW